MKLSQDAKQQGTSYRTALRWFRSGTITGYQAPSGTIIVNEGEQSKPEKVATYARVSQASHKDNLQRQVIRLCDRLYGQRSAKRKTQGIVAELEAQDATR